MYIHTYKHIFRFLKNKFIYLLLLFFYFWLCWVFVTARRLSSVVVAHGLSSCGLWALEHRLSSCGTRASLLRGMWDLPRPGLEPVSLALAGRFLTTVPPGKPLYLDCFNHLILSSLGLFHLLCDILSFSFNFCIFERMTKMLLNGKCYIWNHFSF